MAPAASERVLETRRNIRSEFLYRFLLICGSLLFAWGLIELPALINVLDYRAVLGNQFGWWPMNNINDKELLHIRRPYAHFSGSTRGGGITAGFEIPDTDKTVYHWDDRYDHNGFRNDRDLSRADIIVIGDSMVEGLTVPTSQLMTSLLAQQEHAVVANLGQSAYGPQQELIVLRRYGLQLHPSIVLWMFSESTDLKDVIHYDRAINQPDDFLHAFWSRSFTRMAYLRLFHYSKHTGIERVGYLQTSRAGATPVYFPYAFQALEKADFRAVARTAQIVAGAQKLCAAQNARLIFVFVPDKFRVLHQFCRFPTASECARWPMNDLSERLETVLRSTSPAIGYLDLTPHLVSAASLGLLPYYSDDEHWSPEGHRIAAQAIAAYLSSRAPRTAVTAPVN